MVKSLICPAGWKWTHIDSPKDFFSGFCSPLLSCSLSLFRSGINHIPERRGAARLPPRIPLTQTSPAWIVWYTRTRPSPRAASPADYCGIIGGDYRRVGFAGNEFAGTITENQSEKIPPRSAPLTVKTFQLYKNWNWQTFSCVETLSRRVYRHKSTGGEHAPRRNYDEGLSKHERATMVRLRRHFSV